MSSTRSPPWLSGGASLVGGKGDPLSCVIGVFVLATIVNIMNLVGISSEPQLVIKGAVIIAAVFLSSAGGVERISNASPGATDRGKTADDQGPGASRARMTDGRTAGVRRRALG